MTCWILSSLVSFHCKSQNQVGELIRHVDLEPPGPRFEELLAAALEHDVAQLAPAPGRRRVDHVYDLLQ